MKKTLFISILIMAFITIKSNAQLQVGDPGVTFDNSKNDSDWPQMSEWRTAGKIGGIPLEENLNITVTISSTNSDGINAAINSLPSNGGVVKLRSGSYNINKVIKMKSNVYLIGASRTGVKCNISMTAGNAFRFDNVSNSGIYRMTVQGTWGTPQYKWNIGDQTANNELPNNTNIAFKFKNSNNCFLDKLNIYNVADHPIVCGGTHITFRDLDIKGAFNKNVGYHGYFHLSNAYNLVTGCKVTEIRHISIQGSNAKYNVVYDNDFKQEISFHNDDGGNNLIEKNNITLPSDMWSSYYAIMGPWSIAHEVGGKNYIYKNQILEQNHSNATPWSDNNKIYDGPYVVKPLGAAAIYNNFRAMTANKVPIGGTLYPVVLSGGGSNNGSSPVVTLRKSNTSNYALDGGNGGGNNQNVNLWSYNQNNVNQQWVEIDRGGEFYSYKKKDTNFCIDGGSGGANGNNVKLWTCSETNNNQQFKKVNVSGNFRLQKRNASGYSIDGRSGGSNGQNVHMWSSDSNNGNQLWIITQVGTAAKKATLKNEPISDKGSLKLSIYPNPAQEQVNILIENSSDHADIAILNINGQVIYKESFNGSNYNINTASFSKGIYIIQVTTSNQIMTNKLVIK